MEIELQKKSVDVCERRGQMRVIDMHSHLLCLSEENKGLGFAEKLSLAEEELALRKKAGIATFLSGGRPEEWKFLQQLRDREELLFCCGVHPWYAGQYEALAENGADSLCSGENAGNPSDDLCGGKNAGNTSDNLRRSEVSGDRISGASFCELLSGCDAVGEIGMDSVWCDVPLQVQRRVFVRQLGLAAELGKPVILHTKGQEEQIAELIRDFPGKICVHWYSGGPAALEKLIALGCYFTFGPDLGDSPLYRKMLTEIPADRLFVETDGITSVLWARGIESLEGYRTGACFLPQIPEVLERSMGIVASFHGMDVKALRERMRQNLAEFLK